MFHMPGEVQHGVFAAAAEVGNSVCLCTGVLVCPFARVILQACESLAAAE